MPATRRAGRREMVDPLDLVAQGDPETVVLLPGCSLVGLYIRGVVGAVMLGIREDEVGRPVSCAVTNAFGVETGWPAQSNPRRVADDE